MYVHANKSSRLEKHLLAGGSSMAGFVFCVQQLLDCFTGVSMVPWFHWSYDYSNHVSPPVLLLCVILERVIHAIMLHGG